MEVSHEVMARVETAFQGAAWAMAYIMDQFGWKDITTHVGYWAMSSLKFVQDIDLEVQSDS
jgi:hypothetical protein